jgi:hypothetical protein
MPRTISILLAAVVAESVVGPFAQVGLVAESKPARTDAQNEPLPAGAIARLGSLRVWAAESGSPPNRGNIVRVWEAATGKLVGVPLPHSYPV